MASESIPMKRKRLKTVEEVPDSDISDGDLSPRQLLALAEILTGASLTSAAEVAGCSRRQIYRWMSEDFSFMASYNRGCKNLRREAETSLLSVARHAAETVQRAVIDGNVIASLAVLKGLGLLSGTPPPIASDDPQKLRAAAEADSDFNALLLSLP